MFVIVPVLTTESKMQNDSILFSTSARIKQVNREAASQGTQAEPFRCAHCKLIFKSKVYLFEHLNKVHGFDMDSALREAGLKYPGTNNLNDPEKRCQRKSENPNSTGTGTLVNSENPQSNEAAGTKQSPSVPSVMSTSKNKCSLNSPKDPKRPLHTITKYFAVLPGSAANPPAKFSDDNNRTLILQESSSSSSLNSSGVFKVTARSMFDISNKPDNFVQNDRILITKHNEQFKEKVCKRINSGSSDCHPAKKAKLDIKQTKLPEKDNKQQLSSSSKFSLEVGEDDEGKNVLLNGDTESPTVYFCKHCDYKDVSLRSVSTHYQNNHPYIRCNAAYIQDCDDQSATFRCLECPVEFSSTDDLKKHYMENHPDAQDLFQMKSHEISLVFKCFLCPFTTNILKSLKEHHKEKHPSYVVADSLLYCQYLRRQEESPELNECETPSPETSGEKSSESAHTPCKEAKNSSSPQHPSSKGTEVPSYKCNHCTFSHKSVVVMQVHYKKKHPDEALSIDKIKQSAHVTSPAASQMTPENPPNSVTIKDSVSLKNNTDISKKTQDKAKLLQQLKTSLSLLNSKHRPESSKNHSELLKTKTMESAKDRTKRNMSPTAREREAKGESSLINVYAHAENLFYCQKCNFGNPTILGVLTHQAKTHQPHDYNGKRVINYTAVIRNEIEKSKSQEKEFSFCTDLPLPLMNDGDEKMFFCHFCNYRRNAVSDVMRHYSRTHHGFQVGALQIHQYTSMVLKKTQQSQSKNAGNQDVSPESLREIGTEQKTAKKLTKSFSVSASSSAKASQTRRTLLCYKCQYSTQYVYNLKMHLRETHQLKLSVTEVLRVGFKQGALQPGYHCELCVFTHEKATEVYKHYQEKHPERTSSVEFVTTRLFVGPSSFTLKKKKRKLKHTEGSSNPALVKGDDFDLSSKKASVTNQEEEHNEIPELFDSYQVPLEFDKSFDEATASSTAFKCPYCFASFDTQHGLIIHCGMKHQTDSNENSEEQQQQDQDSQRLHVFKCPHCTYINTSYLGVLTHSHMMHPDVICRPDSLHVDFQNLDVSWLSNGPGDTFKYSGHMCETCPHLCATLAKLKTHCKKEHNETETRNMPSTLKPAPKPSAVTKAQISKAARTQGSISKASFLSKNKYVRIRCPHCPFVCKTKIALSQHLHVHDQGAVSKATVFNCVLCSNSYFRKVRLAGHYIGKHGKDAYLKYFVPIHKQVPKKPTPTSPDQPLTQQSQTTLEPCQSNRTTADNQILVYMCPSCPYVNASHHGTLTHCQMRHPALEARAVELQTTKIFAANMVECKMGKGYNERGYICENCPKMYATLAKLRTHCERGHDEKLIPEDSAETKNQPALSSLGSVSKSASLNNKGLEVSITKNGPVSQSGAPKTSQSNSLLVHNKGSLYKCHMCDYGGSRRRYLYSHYKKTHKLDGFNTSKLLQRYNKRRYKKAHNLLGYEGSSNLKCKTCRHLTFDSFQLLIDHYCTFHHSDFKSDFTVLSLGFKHKTTGCYKCARCNKQLNGIKKLCLHLDQHREMVIKNAAKTKSSLVITTTSEPENIQLDRQDELITSDTVEELTKLDLTPVKTFSLPTSPMPSPSSFKDVEQPKLESAVVKNTCKLCGRTFMSLEGLRSHERSHAALAAIKKLDNVPASTLKNNISKYVSYKPGTTRPFLCSCCTYRTTVLGLWWRHFIKKHPDVEVTDETDDKYEDRTHPADKMHFPELSEELELTEKSLYSEPPNVQRQLNHYNLMAQNNDISKVTVHELQFPDNSLLHCEFCSFHTGHLSSMRRHYLNRHGKKMFRCKDCEFFTGLRKTLEMHMETGHSNCQSQPTHVKDLHCPFCLYQTKNKNNMIDHIVLHREERVVPIEVRRPKLSRYLQGIVFRCHKCTFTSGSDENLRLHMTRHDDIKPYKCRLCYFDCTRLSDLEEHLSDKHQVVRNHELVGQVSLDQLEARDGRIPEKEVEPVCKLENHHNDSEDGETEEFTDTDCNDVPQAENPAEKNTREKITLRLNKAHHKQGRDGNEESSAKSSVLDIQYENLNSKPTVERTHEHAKVFEHRKLNIEAKVEDNILCHIRFLDDNRSIYNPPKKADQERTIKIEQDIETIDSNCVLSLKGSPSLAQNQQKTVNKQASKINHSQENYRDEKSFSIKKHFLTHSPNYVQLKLSHKDDLDTSVPKRQLEQLHNQQNCEEAPDLYGEMPVLENEYLKEEMDTLRSCKEEEGSNHTAHTHERKAGITVGGNKNRCSDQDSTHLLEDSLTTMEAAAEVLHPSAKEDKRYICEYCGRNLMDTSELKRHIMRHGI